MNIFYQFADKSLSADPTASTNYSNQIIGIMNYENMVADQIYNASAIGFLSKTELNVVGHNILYTIVFAGTLQDRVN